MTGLRLHIIIVVWIFATSVAQGQNYIGLHKDSIQKTLRKDFPDFRMDNSSTNTTYKYLKFVDRVNEQTALFFLSGDNMCTRVRWMSDYSNLNDMTNMLDARFRKEGDMKWAYRSSGRSFSITLDEDEWYFTVNFFED